MSNTNYTNKSFIPDLRFSSCVFSMLCLMFFIFGLQSAQAQKNCRQSYEKISQYYQKYLTHKVYLKYSAHTVLNGKSGEKVLCEIWGDGTKAKLENQFVTVYQDEKDQVVILKDRKLILIRKVRHRDKFIHIPNDLKVLQNFETLLDNTISIQCNETGNKGRISIIYNDSFVSKYSIKRVAIDYDSGTQGITKGIYEYHRPDGSQLSEIYNYLDFSQEFDPEVLAKDALDHIYEGGQLKRKYKGFRIKDLRGKQAVND